MQLQDHARPDGDELVVFVDRFQYVAIAGDLTLAPSLRGGLVHDEFLQPVVGGDDALDAVGRLRALDLRDLQQLGKGVLLYLREKVLLSFLLMDLNQK